MAVHLIVDGYNVIRQSPVLAPLDRRDLEAGRAALLTRLVAYRRAKHHPVTVVFDGRSGTRGEARARWGGVDVIFSSAGESADAVIERLARREGGRAVVVTSDRALREACRRSRAEVIPSGEFEARLAAAVGEAGPAEGSGPGSGGGRDPGLGPGSRGVGRGAGAPEEWAVKDRDDEPEPPPRKGLARRPSKAARRAAARLRKL
ncbi:MAG: NYN domain-containing protein [Deltaproteobacteria bacterium]|nr:NYN domain-containing protein [Deltaproteobacteria bacterium]